MTLRRLQTALALYAALAIAGALLITDNRVRMVLGAVLAGLALKTFAAYRLGQMDPPGDRSAVDSKEPD